VIGRSDGGANQDEVTVIETNVDDSTPEHLGFLMERLFAEGALDVSFTPILMKKNRPGTMISVISRPEEGERLARLVLTHSSSLGVRMQRMERRSLPRRQEVVETPFGPVRVTIARAGEVTKIAPEFEECARIARERGVPLPVVMEAAIRGVRR